MDEENRLFNTLEKYRPACIVWLMGRNASAADAEDCVQMALESILYIARKTHEYSCEKYPGLLYDISWKRLKDVWRNKNSQNQRLDDTHVEFFSESPPEMSASEMDAVSLRKALANVFDEFNPKRGKILYTSWVEGRKPEEIAVHFQMTSGSVRATISSLKKPFRDWVAHHDLQYAIWELFRRYFTDGRWPWDRGMAQK